MAAKKTPPARPVDLIRAESLKKLALARASIGKAVKLQPLTAHYGQHPHVPSGSILVDSLIGGNLTRDGQAICPGFPRRRISEVFGPESSGKTTLALSALAALQAAGGSAMFLDFERALDYRYASTIGVDFSEGSTIIPYAPESMEDGFKCIYTACAAGIDLVVVDSVAAMVPAGELAKGLDDAAKVGAVAAYMARMLPRVVSWLDGKVGKERKDLEPGKGTALLLLNQERASIQAGGGHAPPEANSTGGKALKFYATLRLRTTRYKTEKVSRKDPFTGKVKDIPYGIVTRIKVVKDKLDGKAGQDADVFIRYGFGIDDAYSVIEAGVANGIMGRSGSSYTYGQVKVIGRDKLRQFFLDNPTIYEEARSKVVASILSLATPISDKELSEEDQIAAELESEIGGGDDDDMPEVEEAVVEADDANGLG